MNCNLENVGNNRCRCINPGCNKTIVLPNGASCENILSTCRSDISGRTHIHRTKAVKMEKPPENKAVDESMPSLTSRLAHFAISAIKHQLNGNPTCTQEEVDERFTICKACPFLREKRGKNFCGHLGCGCNVNNGHNKYLNKLAWKDQICPDTPPRWEKIDFE